jgi:hypothetical protein
LPQTDVTAASNITISGLTGSQTVSGALQVSVTVDSGAVSVFESDEGQWTLGESGSGTLVLTVSSGGLTAGTDYVIGFTLRNQANERQTAAEVRVEASVHSGAAAGRVSGCLPSERAISISPNLTDLGSVFR